jgi:hypothetical protein
MVLRMGSLSRLISCSQFSPVHFSHSHAVSEQDPGRVVYMHMSLYGQLQVLANVFGFTRSDSSPLCFLQILLLDDRTAGMSKRRKRPPPSPSHEFSFDEGLSPEQFVADLEAQHADPFTTMESRQGTYSLNYFDNWGFLPPHLRYFVNSLYIDDTSRLSASGRASSPDGVAGHIGVDTDGNGGSDLDVDDSHMDPESVSQHLPNPAPHNVHDAEEAGSSSYIPPPRATGVAAAVQLAVPPSMVTDSQISGLPGTD